MDTKDVGTIQLDKGTKKIECHKFKSKELGRTLMIHIDVDNKNHVSVSDEKTGFRMYGIPTPITKLKMEQVEEGLDRFIKHFELPLIMEEFERLENSCN